MKIHDEFVSKEVIYNDSIIEIRDKRVNTFFSMTGKILNKKTGK